MSSCFQTLASLTQTVIVHKFVAQTSNVGNHVVLTMRARKGRIVAMALLEIRKDTAKLEKATVTETGMYKIKKL